MKRPFQRMLKKAFNSVGLTTGRSHLSLPKRVNDQLPQNFAGSGLIHYSFLNKVSEKDGEVYGRFKRHYKDRSDTKLLDEENAWAEYCIAKHNAESGQLRFYTPESAAELLKGFNAIRDRKRKNDLPFEIRM